VLANDVSIAGATSVQDALTRTQQFLGVVPNATATLVSIASELETAGNMVGQLANVMSALQGALGLARTLPQRWTYDVCTQTATDETLIRGLESDLYARVVALKASCLAVRDRLLAAQRPLAVRQALATAGPSCANPNNATVQPCLHTLSRAPVSPPAAFPLLYFKLWVQTLNSEASYTAPGAFDGYTLKSTSVLATSPITGSAGIGNVNVGYFPWTVLGSVYHPFRCVGKRSAAVRGVS
jgi:hypothetical protein